MATLESDVQPEIAFWIFFLTFSFYRQDSYWTVLFVSFFSTRVGYIAITQWLPIPATPTTFSSAVIALLWLSAWLAEITVATYFIFLTPIHLIISPMDLLDKYSTDVKPLEPANVLYKPKKGVKIEYAKIHDIGNGFHADYYKLIRNTWTRIESGEYVDIRQEWDQGTVA
jgi:hypothetical protein